MQYRAATLTEHNCIAIPLLLLVGPLKAENLWETWINIKEPESEAIFEMMSGQPHQFVHFVGDTGNVELCLQGPNTLADFARQALLEQKAMPSWSRTLFEQLGSECVGGGQTSSPCGTDWRHCPGW